MNRWNALLFACATMALSAAHAAPGLINYQGQLTDPLGVPVDTAVDVTFTFHDAVSEGNQLGEFTDTDTVIPDASGIYSTDVGDEDNLVPFSIFDDDKVWLNVKVGEEDLAPRLRVMSAGFALRSSNADALQGLKAADFLNVTADAYIVVKMTASATQNAVNLQEAYAAAKLLTPNGAALSALNRATVIVPPGSYNLGASSFTMDEDFVDLAGLTSLSRNKQIYSTGHVLIQTASNVRIENLLIRRAGFDEEKYAYWPAAVWGGGAKIGSPSTTWIRNCEFMTSGNSMRRGVEFAGSYEDCIAGGNYGFGGEGTASGTFINCTGGDYAFGGGADAVASGTLTNCVGGDFAFGGGNGDATGTFTNSRGAIGSFGGYGTATGLFTNCVGGNYAFGGSGNATGGKFYYCNGGFDSFGGGASSLYCIQAGSLF